MGFVFMALAFLIHDGLSFRDARWTVRENKQTFYFSLYFFNSMHYYRFLMYSMSHDQGALVTLVRGEALCVFCLAW